MTSLTTQPTKSEKNILVFLGTSTNEKLRDFKYICEQKSLPIHFLDLRKLLDAFHSADETGGKYKSNVRAKLGDVENSISMIARDEDFLRKKCEEYGFAYDPAHIYFATEDGGVGVCKDILAQNDKQRSLSGGA